MDKYSKQEIDSIPYITGWRLSGEDLTKWIQTNELHISGTSKMNVNAYIERNRGDYTFTWTEEEGRRLYFGAIPHPDETESIGIVLKDNMEATVQLGAINFRMEKVRVDFSEEAIKVPRRYYRQIGKILLHPKYLKKRIPKHGRFKGLCKRIEKLKKHSKGNFDRLTARMVFSNNVHFDLYPECYITRHGDFCTVLIEMSEDDTWILGSSFLRHYSVIIDTKGETIQYEFQAPREFESATFESLEAQPEIMSRHQSMDSVRAYQIPYQE
uniref:AlNc14C340G10792 protein n=1 Tax=Albugo laibachii Nc14 TaxID=890382 RepID=F0WX35_9STRA|nr:AlNc14C340G10792 [Albugo laibachii Nc14]|eukprot:CCA26024.1 AlNc14C340G10792 [Albugo laibachii Nc14]